MAQKSRSLQDTCRDNLIAAFPLINEAGKSSAGCEERPYFPGKNDHFATTGSGQTQ
jgi:hypothetical protein